MFICKTLSSVNAANVNAFFQQIHTYASNISTMGVASDVFRESLAHVEARIAEELAKKKELERKRAEGEVGYLYIIFTTLSLYDDTAETEIVLSHGPDHFTTLLLRWKWFTKI